MDPIGTRIKQVRTQQGLTQTQFASEMAISQTHVSKIEKGVEHPSSTLLRLMSLKYNIDETWLTDGVGGPTPDWDIRTDEGVISKYNAMRVSFEKKIHSRTGEDLLSTVEAFAYFDALLSPRKLTDEDKTKYLASICSTVDQLEKLVFMVSSDSLLPSKRNVKSWFSLHKKCEAKLKVISEHIKNSVNLYLACYGDEMKL
jgi:transcriptional regulator with XRE-family HTH domain